MPPAAPAYNRPQLSKIGLQLSEAATHRSVRYQVGPPARKPVAARCSTIRVLDRLPPVAWAVAWLRTHPAPDLLFLNTHLEDDLGFRIFEQVPVATPVIFTTAHDGYMVPAFKVNSIDYLLKPIAYGVPVAALDKQNALHQHFATAPSARTALPHLLGKPAYRDRFMVSIGPRLRSVEVSEIACFFWKKRPPSWLTSRAPYCRLMTALTGSAGAGAYPPPRSLLERRPGGRFQG